MSSINYGEVRGSIVPGHGVYREVIRTNTVCERTSAGCAVRDKDRCVHIRTGTIGVGAGECQDRPRRSYALA